MRKVTKWKSTSNDTSLFLRHLLLYLCVFITTGLFFGSFVSLYKKMLSPFFNPVLVDLLAEGQNIVGIILYFLAVIIIIVLWCEIKVFRQSVVLGKTFRLLLVALSFHYLIIRLLLLFFPQVFQITWSFLPLHNSVFKFSDIATLPFVLMLLKTLLEQLQNIYRHFTKSTKTQSDTEPAKIKVEGIVWEEDYPVNSMGTDLFNRKDLVVVIANKILTWKPKESSFNIAITGEWGSGKSSFLNMVKSELNEKAVVVSYVPWSYHSSTDLTAEFFSQLASTLRGSNNFHDLARIIRNTVSGNGLWWNFVSNLMNYPTTYEELKNSIADALGTKNSKPLVIIVDELDRLSSSELVEVLKLLKNLASIKGSFIITSFDKSAIIHNLTDIKESSKYLEKFFQLEIPLVKISLSQTVGIKLTDWMRKLGIKEEFLQGISSTMNCYDGLNYRESGTDKFTIWQRLNTIRKLTIFQNTINTQIPFLKDKIDLYSYMLLELIRLNYPEVFVTILNKESIRTNWNNPFTYTFYDSAPIIVTTLKTLEQKSSREKEALQEVLNYLFPSDASSRIPNAPNSTYFFEFYVSDYLYKKVDLYKLATLRQNHQDDEMIEELKKQADESQSSKAAIIVYIQQYTINTNEDLFTEFKLVLTLGDFYEDHSEKVIKSLSRIEQQGIYVHTDFEEELKEILINRCSDVSINLFVLWFEELRHEPNKTTFNLRELIELFLHRLEKYYSLNLSMSTIHNLLLPLLNENLDVDQLDSLKSAFIQKLKQDDGFANRYLRYCLYVMELPKSINTKLPYASADDELSFNWIKSVSLFDNWESFHDFLIESENENPQSDLAHSAKRILTFIRKGGPSVRSLTNSVGVRVKKSQAFDYGIRPPAMDPEVFKNVIL